MNGNKPENDKKDKDLWDKLAASAKFIGAFAAIFGSILIPYYLHSNSEQNRKAQMYAQIMTKREEADTTLRSKMFETLIDNYLGKFTKADKTKESGVKSTPTPNISGLEPEKESTVTTPNTPKFEQETAETENGNIDNKIMFLSLLSKNFQDYFNVKPLFVQLYKQIQEEENKILEEIFPKLKDEECNKLYRKLKIANEDDFFKFYNEYIIKQNIISEVKLNLKKSIYVCIACIEDLRRTISNLISYKKDQKLNEAELKSLEEILKSQVDRCKSSEEDIKKSLKENSILYDEKEDIFNLIGITNEIEKIPEDYEKKMKMLKDVKVKLEELLKPEYFKSELLISIEKYISKPADLEKFLRKELTTINELLQAKKLKSDFEKLLPLLKNDSQKETKKLMDKLNKIKELEGRLLRLARSTASRQVTMLSTLSSIEEKTLVINKKDEIYLRPNKNEISNNNSISNNYTIELEAIHINEDTNEVEFEVSLFKHYFQKKFWGISPKTFIDSGLPEPIGTPFTFWISYFDMPYMDNTQLDDDTRFAVILKKIIPMKNHDDMQIVVKVIRFPEEFMTLRDRPLFEEMLTKLRQN